MHSLIQQTFTEQGMGSKFTAEIAKLGKTNLPPSKRSLSAQEKLQMKIKL